MLPSIVCISIMKYFNIISKLSLKVFLWKVEMAIFNRVLRNSQKMDSIFKRTL